jgi:hypothetical protein
MRAKASIAFLFVALCADLAFSASRPEIQQQLDNKSASVVSALSWNWCDWTTFEDFGLHSPWAADGPSLGVSVLGSACSETKSSWELYDRKLNSGDLDTKVLAKSAQDLNFPYFAFTTVQNNLA